MKWNCFGSADSVCVCVCVCVCVNKEKWTVFREAIKVLEGAVDNTGLPPSPPSPVILHSWTPVYRIRT